MIKFTIQMLALFYFMTFNSNITSAESLVYSGGCFWCTEADMEKLKGVSEVISGFTAGTTKNPKYIPGKWGDHREAAKVTYDPQIITFENIVKHIFKTIDYEDKNISQNSDQFRKISNEASAQNRNGILQSYDYLLNNKYKVIINEKTLDRVKNYFR